MIRCFNHPVIFSARTLSVHVVTLRSPLAWRRLAWRIRKHPELALRACNLELVRPGAAVPWIDDGLRGTIIPWGRDRAGQRRSDFAPVIKSGHDV